MDFTRQQDIVDPDVMASLTVTIAGVGGIGSPTALVLSKLGVGKIVAIDPDHVEDVNLPGQLYRLQDAANATPKSEATRQICGEFAGAQVESVQDVAENQELEGIVVSAVDSMAARGRVWRSIIEQMDAGSPSSGGRVEWLIDARMGAENGTLYAVRPSSPLDQLYYESQLYRDDEALQLPCTGRATVHNGWWIASLIGRAITQVARGNSPERRIDFDLRDLSLIVETV